MKKPPGGGKGAVLIKVREEIQVVPGFGVTYRITRRTWLLFGIIPIAWSKETKRG